MPNPENLTPETRRLIAIHFALGTPRVGIWCDTCLTSARYEVDILILGSEGLGLLRTVNRCDRCDDDA
jgi:hypothetical protein